MANTTSANSLVTRALIAKVWNAGSTYWICKNVKQQLVCIIEEYGEPKEYEPIRNGLVEIRLTDNGLPPPMPSPPGRGKAVGKKYCPNSRDPT